ncbi:MAG: HAMP domain-containing protein, partial [Planctomycetaceae bacterium]|nr:HAMP domain-containing protein [Planctomycetaceae bacterium]
MPEILWRRHLQKFSADAESALANPSSTDSPANEAPQEPAAAFVPDEESSVSTEHPPNDDAGADSAGPAADHLSFEEFRSRLEDVPELGIGVKWSLIGSRETPSDDRAYQALVRFRNAPADGSGGPSADESWHLEDTESGERFLNYYAAVRAKSNCLKCHNGSSAERYEAGSLVALATVTASMESVVGQLSRNRAILLASAIVTTFIAMLVAYIIVRYIIVKPVLHLKDVSDEIARGNLNLRADINTGDEFEELSHAFNRMLRHMTTVNDELRALNDSLDAKVDELAQANLELFNSNALKDEFLATMSHELRTP